MKKLSAILIAISFSILSAGNVLANNPQRDKGQPTWTNDYSPLNGTPFWVSRFWKWFVCYMDNQFKFFRAPRPGFGFPIQIFSPYIFFGNFQNRARAMVQITKYKLSIKRGLQWQQCLRLKMALMIEEGRKDITANNGG